MNEAKGLVIAGWSAGNTAKMSTRALSGMAQAVGNRLVWLAIFSPVWLALIGITDGLIRLRRRIREIIHQVAVYYSGLAPHEAMQHPEEIESVDAPDKRQE